ncbi:MAG TPA: formate dehydrogenase accessory sulfurtransferase FdhD [Methylophilaceae bacterium]|nr:formate dehydrogenase accessory sulfurtransferase FdhD [Methylophilaceae bacterium]
MKKWFAQNPLAIGQYKVSRLQADRQLIKVTDRLAEEVPIALVYNGVSHAVMLASPQDLEDFALGFSITEGILKDKCELYDIDVEQHEEGIELHLRITSERFLMLKERRRSMAGRTGCGLCGTESLSQVFHLPDLKNANIELHNSINVDSLFKAYQDMQAKQIMQKSTGATHACAWADESGNIQYLREDVGRHNALDKLLGALCKADAQGGFVLTTSRASYEMVQKLIMAGFDILAAISAPTGLAVKIAEAYGVTLVGFLREQQFVAYTHVKRIVE